MRLPVFVALSAGLAGLNAQPAATFDASSIHANPTGVNPSKIDRSGGRLTVANASLRDCIEFAFTIPTGREYQLVGPDWMGSAKFDIAATFSPDATRDQIREMLRNLLSQRFGLRTHRQNRSVSAYFLTVAAKGPRLKPTTAGDDGAVIYGEDHADFRATSMTVLADRLSGPIFHLDRPVIDQTGLTGAYDFSLKWTPFSAAGPDAANGFIFTALQEQCGLRLVAHKATVSILVVDKIERTPTAE